MGMVMSQTNAQSTNSLPWKEFLGFSAIIIAAYIAYLGNRAQAEIPIQATQTAEARSTSYAQTKESPAATINPALSIMVIETPTMTVGETPTIIATQTAEPTLMPLIAEQDLDLSVGAGNWECIYGVTDSVIIDKIPPNFVVQFPFTKIYDSKNDKYYYISEIVPDKIMATAKLEGSLPNNFYCSTERTKLTHYSIFSILAASNRGSGSVYWECISHNSKAVKVDIPNTFVVNGAIAFAEQNNIRIEKGYSLQSGTAIIWFEYEIMPSVCP